MLITVISYKGGVAKTTTAIHLAAVLSNKFSTLLIDFDPNESALEWAKRGIKNNKPLPFPVSKSHEGKPQMIVMDSKARPDEEDLILLAEKSDLVVIPCTPDALSFQAVGQTIKTLNEQKARFKILLTIVPPRPSRAGERARDDLQGLPVLKAQIPRLTAFQKAAELGCLVRDLAGARAAAGWQAYVDAGKEILR